MSQVLVFGKSIPALVAALDLAELGIGVRIAPGAVEVPARGVTDATGEVAQLLERIASPIAPGGHRHDAAHAVVSPPTRVCLRGRDGEWKPQPEPHVWGVPAVPISTDAAQILGMGGSLRAYVDRLKPVLTIGKEANLGKLIESRIGASASARLAEPFVYERFGVMPSEVDVAIAAPGLNESLTIAGSLSGAVMQYADRFVARETRVQPAAGWSAFAELLIERLVNYGAERLSEAVVKLEADESGVWIATDESGRARSYSAVIAGDAESLPRGCELRAEISAHEPQDYRAYAEIGIRPPFELDSAPVGALGERVTELLELVDSPDGARWSVRAVRENGDSWVARLAGPAVRGDASLLDHQAASALLQAAGFTALGEDLRVWREPAPHVDLSEREGAEASLTAWHADRETVVLASDRLHRGDLGLALADAQAQAVHLRRKLTGIAE